MSQHLSNKLETKCPVVFYGLELGGGDCSPDLLYATFFDYYYFFGGFFAFNRQQMSWREIGSGIGKLPQVGFEPGSPEPEHGTILCIQ